MSEINGSTVAIDANHEWWKDDTIFENKYAEECKLEEKKKNLPFDGKLKKEEIQLLRECSYTDEEIKQVQYYVYKYREYLTGFIDLIGDKAKPTKQLLFNLKHFGYLLEADPEKVVSKAGIVTRNLTADKLVRAFGPLFLKNKQIFEKRREFSDILSFAKYLPDKIEIPKEPVIWTPNHHFKDDVLASYLATKRASYILFGSLPQFYNSFDGVLAYLIGSYMTNRKNDISKSASVAKSIYGSKLGVDTLCFPEGVWDKSLNQLLLEFWKGIYLIAQETGEKVVPIIHYIYDPTLQIPSKLNPIHTIVDDPFDITYFSERAGLNYLREILATWYDAMMEKYGHTTREDLMKFYENRAYAYNSNLTSKDFEKRPITAHEAGEIYFLDLLQTVEYYDTSIETTAAYQSKTIIRPETAFQDIAKIKNVTPENVRNVLDASSLVRTRKLENYQSRF